MIKIDLNDLYGTLPPATFAALFCYKIRQDERLQNVVSTRQAIAITKLLIATCFRKTTTNLSPDDYIRTATISTTPEDQEIARQVAMDILFPKLSFKEVIAEKSSTQETSKKIVTEVVSEITAKAPSTDEKQDSLSKGVLNGLTSFLDEMAEDFGDLMIPQPKLEVEESDESDLLDFYFDALDNLRAKNQPHYSLLSGLDDLTELLTNKISNLSDLTEYVDQKLLSSLNNIPPSLLPAIPHSSVIDSIMKNSVNPIEQGIAQHSLDKGKFNQFIDNLDPESLAKVAKALLDSQMITRKQFEKFAEKAAIRATNSSEIFNVIKTIQELSSLAKEKFFDIATNDLSLVKALEMTQALQQIPTVSDSLMNDLLDTVVTKPGLEDKLSYHALPALPIFNKNLHQGIQNSFTKEGQRLKQLNNPQKFEELFNEVSNIKDQIKNPYYYNLIKQMRNTSAQDWMSAITAKQNFLNTGHSLVRQGITFDENQIMNHGLSIGCFEEEILEMLYTDYEKFLKAIKRQTTDIDGYRNMLSRLNLTTNQLQSAITQAFSSNNKDAIAAFACDHLQETSQLANASGQINMLMSSLSAGPGEDLLKQWFIARDRLPSSLRLQMKQILRNIVITTAMDMARMKLGSAEAGLMLSNDTRVYREGDEFDQIDIEGTLDNLIMMGKDFKQIVPDDFIVHDLRKGRVALLVLLDVSGSMSGLERLTYCAFLITMLVSRLREEEIAVAIFESNTHVIMEFEEDRPEIDLVIDELLEIKPMGGTVINETLNWAYEQFRKLDEENLYFLVASDFEFFYEVQNLDSFKGIQKLKPKTYLMTPRSGISEKELNIWEKTFGTEGIKIQNEKQIIDIVCKIISNR